MEGVPASRMSSNIRVRSSEALMTAEHTLEGESVLTRTTYDGNAGYTFSTVKKLNNDSVEVGLLTLQSRVSPVVHTAGFFTTEHRLDVESSLKRTAHEKNVQKHSFFSVSTSSPNKIMGFKNTRRVGSSPNINTRSKSTSDISPSLLDSGKAINGGECQQTQTLKRHQSGVKSREKSEESRLQFQRCKPWADLAREFPQKQLHQQNLQRFHGIKHSQGASPSKKFHQKKLQQSHAIMFSQSVKNSREHALPALNKEDNPSSRISIKPSLLEDSLEGLERRSAPPIDTSSIKNSGIPVSSESITREKTFMEGSFINKPGSWLTFAFLTLLIVCSCLTLKILLLEIEIARQHGLLERCTSVDFDMVTKGLEEQPNKRDSGIAYQEMFMKGLSKVALLVIIVHLLFVPFLLKNKIHQLHELSRKFITGTEEDAPIDKRIAYGVDILFSTRPYMKATALLLATVLLICGGGIALFTVSDDSISDAMWRAWTYVADSGNHADSEGTWPRIVSVLISFGGMLIFALMLGLISDAISEKVDSLRKGKSEVIESGHTLILGWSDKLGSLLKQLAIANQSLGGGVVVVLAERDKEEMELDIAKLEFNFMGTSVICRSGSPLIMADLKKVSVSKARAIIVLAEIDNADQSDARALRVVLSLAGIKEGLKGHIVVEMRDLDNEALVKLVGGEMVETVVAHDVIGRLMIQCARQPGLAQIWEDILGFEKAEFYIKRWPELDGMCFGEVLISFPDAIPCGVKVYAEAGRIVLNPDDDYVLCEGDEILVIAEDDDTYAPAHLPQVRESPLLQAKRSQKKPQKILLCGWRRDIEDMITVLDAFLASGSEVWIFSDVPECDREKKLLYGNLIPENLENIQLVHREGNTVIRRHLESLPLEDFDSILILADEKLEDTVVNADSSSLATLLLIRDIQSKRLPLEVSRGSYNRAQVHSQSSWIREMHEASNKTIIISEILDSRTKNLVSVSKISDYVLSNELVSMALAMVAEDKQINRVLEELFAEEGNELYIRPAEFYLYDQEEVSFFEIMIRARQREEIVIGYRQASADQAVINPSNKDALQRWSLQDVFVVLAFEE